MLTVILSGVLAAAVAQAPTTPAAAPASPPQQRPPTRADILRGNAVSAADVSDMSIQEGGTTYLEGLRRTARRAKAARPVSAPFSG